MKWLSFSTDQISVEPPQSNILKRKEVLQNGAQTGTHLSFCGIPCI